MVGGKRELSADGCLRLAGWLCLVDRRLRRGVRAVDCMHGVAAPASIAAQRLGEYVALGAQDPTAKRRVVHAAQVLAAHGESLAMDRSPVRWSAQEVLTKNQNGVPSATNVGLLRSERDGCIHIWIRSQFFLSSANTKPFLF